MDSLTISLAMGIFALPAAAIFIIVYICISEIKTRKQRKIFIASVKRCKEIHGCEFTSKVLSKCIEGRLPYESMISVLQHHIEGEKQ